VLATLVTVLALAASGKAVVQQQAPFPHDRHNRLFVFCEGCHLGVARNDSSTFYPAANLCSRCHDGAQVARVNWTAATREIDNLRYDHVSHAAAVARTNAAPMACESCHAPQPGARMRIERAPVGTCLGCHAHQATAHLVDARCSTCHLPLAETQFDTARIVRLPIPPDHGAEDFLETTHAALAQREVTSCSTCHTRERCTSCHVNSARITAIAGIPAAPQRMALPRWTAEYPIPESHESPDWIDRHGRSATAASCGTCHTRENCESCHRTQQPPAVAGLVRRSDSPAPGVATMTAAAPTSHASPAFVRGHGVLAATASASCTTCHTRESCARCHDRTALSDAAAANNRNGVTAAHITADTVRRSTRTSRPESEFHPPTFLLRHSASAYNRRLECANCHDVRVFCRDCHTQSGFSTAVGTSRLTGAFHDAEPLWLLRHPRAARQSLESCTACHSQRDCLRCHSQLGAFRVSPHGDGFDARRAQKRNAVICFACHLDDPLRGGG
jgi:hypothetical protein